MNQDLIPQTEVDLIAALQANQSAAFAFLYTAYSPALFGILLYLVKDKEKAKDLLHDAFIKVWASIHHYDPERGRLFTWLQTLTRNVALSDLRAHRVRLEARSYIQQQTPDRTYQTSPDGMPNQPLISLLEPKNGQILALIAQGYTSSAIATLLSLPIGTVKTWRRQGLQQLQYALRQDIRYYRHG